MNLSSLALLIMILSIFIIFLIAFLLVYKSNIKKERDELIIEILRSKPNPSAYNKIRNLGYEDNYGWTWNDRIIKELSYDDLLEVYNKIYA